MIDRRAELTHNNPDAKFAHWRSVVGLPADFPKLLPFSQRDEFISPKDWFGSQHIELGSKFHAGRIHLDRQAHQILLALY